MCGVIFLWAWLRKFRHAGPYPSRDCQLTLYSAVYKHACLTMVASRNSPLGQAHELSLACPVSLDILCSAVVQIMHRAESTLSLHERLMVISS